MTTKSELRPLLRRGVAEIIVEEELLGLLESGRRLRLKQGFDPSRPDIHLGHVVGLRKLRQFQELGHQVILIVGDWTAQIGDPSGQSLTRPMLSHEQVLENAESYMKQFFKVVDRERTEVRWQSEWFGQFSLKEVLHLTSRFTVAQLMAREDFARRLEAGQPVAVTELLYPLLQAYDSVMIEADVEFGGTDQKFNCLVGRELQVKVGQPPQQVFLVPLLVGTDGRQKMSKSLGNYIGVDDPPEEMFGKVMSIPDELILPYLEFLTDVAEAELEECRQAMAAQAVNPMELKQRLGREIVSQFHSPHQAEQAQEHFGRLFQRHQLPQEIPVVAFQKEVTPEGRAVLLVSLSGQQEGIAVEVIPSTPPAYQGDAVDLLAVLCLAPSRSEAKRLLAQGAVEVDGHRIEGRSIVIRDGSVIRVGTRRFLRLAEKP